MQQLRRPRHARMFLVIAALGVVAAGAAPVTGLAADGCGPGMMMVAGECAPATTPEPVDTPIPGTPTDPPATNGEFVVPAPEPAGETAVLGASDVPEGEAAAGAAATATGTLPFTGAPLGSVALAGFLLVGVGLLLARSSPTAGTPMPRADVWNRRNL